MKFTTSDNEVHVIDPASVKRISGGEKTDRTGVLTFMFYGEEREWVYLLPPHSVHHVLGDYEDYLRLIRPLKKP
jgi:hypothetical protein